MMLEILLWCVAALLLAAPVGLAAARVAPTRALAYLPTLLVSGVALASAAGALLAQDGSVQTLTLPLGLPWLGAHVRLDPIAAAFLVVVNLGGATASLSRQVTVTAAPVNQPPVASFTTSCTDLSCSVDASGALTPQSPRARAKSCRYSESCCM